MIDNTGGVMLSIRYPISLPLLIFVLPCLALAADINGQFAIKSVGTQNCQHYIAAYEKGGDEYILYGGYLGGYTSAYNQLASGTFDIVPWQSADTIARMLVNYCHKHPHENFAAAFAKLISQLRHAQLDSASEIVEIGYGDRLLRIYRHVLRDVQTKLIALGHFSGEANGRFNPATSAALEQFQQQTGLAKTGVPNQATLFRLYY